MPAHPRRPVPRSLHQRWRERPRRRAQRLTPGCPDGVVHAIVGRVGCACVRAQIVRDNRAARVHRSLLRCGRATSVEVGSRTSPIHRQNMAPSPVQIEARHHRADDAGAVLGVVNALRSAATRPVAGPAGIDDASARHDLGYYAMAGFLMARASRESEVDAGFPLAYLDVSRLCLTAHPPHRTQCMQSAFPVVALRARFKRTPTTSRQAATLSRRREPAHLTRDHADFSSTRRLEDRASLRTAFGETHARPCLGRTRCI